MLPCSVANNRALSDRHLLQVIEESQVKEIRDVRAMYDRFVEPYVSLSNQIFREVEDLKSAIDSQSRNYRELQVHWSPPSIHPPTSLFQTASEKVLTDNRDLKSMQARRSRSCANIGCPYVCNGALA